MASDKLIFLVLFSLCIQNTIANRIRIIEVLTSDCEDCGMSAFGQLSIKVILGWILFWKSGIFENRDHPIFDNEIKNFEF